MDTLGYVAYLAATDQHFRSTLRLDPARALRERALVPEDDESSVLLALLSELTLPPDELLQHFGMVTQGPDWTVLTEMSASALIENPRLSVAVELWLAEVEEHIDAALRPCRESAPLRRDLATLWEATDRTRAAVRPMLLLTFLACEASGGSGRETSAAAAAWSLLHLAAHLQDSLADDDPLPIARELGAARVMTLATALTFAAQRALLRSNLPAERVVALQQAYADAALKVTIGQYSDLCAPSGPATGWKGLADKTAPAIALACRAGAIVAGASPGQCAALTELGNLMGLMIQLADDYKDFRKEGPAGDLAAGRPSLLLCLARSLGGAPWQGRLGTVLAMAPRDPRAEAEARRLLPAIGAIHYWFLTMERCRQAAETIIAGMDDEAADATHEAVRGLTSLLELLAPWKACVRQMA